jgi:PAB-dependent poly(A)-specific ribonuclease subunit 3
MGEGSNASTPGLRQDTVTPDWTVAEVQEFVPQGFDNSHLVSRAFLGFKSQE